MAPVRCAVKGDESGMSLVEILVTITLLAVVSTLVLAGIEQAGSVLAQVDDENRGLQDAKVILDRLGRDLRQARAVECNESEMTSTVISNGPPRHTACDDHVQMWIDNGGAAVASAGASDYARQPEEVVTWSLRSNGDHFDVLRTQGVDDAGNPNGTPVVQATALIVGTLFEYNAEAFSDVDLVTLRMFYNAVGRGVLDREASTSVRLRNKG